MSTELIKTSSDRELREAKLDEISKDVTSDLAKYELEEDGTIKTDDIGRPVFKGCLELIVSPIITEFLWNTIKLTIEEGIVPTPEVDGVLKLMEMVAAWESDEDGKVVELKINYATGLWHVLHVANQFQIYGRKVKGSQSNMAKTKAENRQILADFTLYLATKIDNYHHGETVVQVPKEVTTDKEISIVAPRT